MKKQLHNASSSIIIIINNNSKIGKVNPHLIKASRVTARLRNNNNNSTLDSQPLPITPVALTTRGLGYASQEWLSGLYKPTPRN